MFRAGSPFSGKFVLFKPVLFVQVVPVECDGCWSLDMAEDVRLTSRLEEVVPGSAFGGRASRVQLHAHSISKTATVRRCSSFQSSSPSFRISNAFLDVDSLTVGNSRLEDAITGSTLDAGASRGLHQGLTRHVGRRERADIAGNLRGEVDRALENSRGGV